MFTETINQTDCLPYRMELPVVIKYGALDLVRMFPTNERRCYKWYFVELNTVHMPTNEQSNFVFKSTLLPVECVSTTNYTHFVKY